MNHDQLERIRLLSSRFHQLQGLRVAAAGASLAAVMGLYLLVASAPTDNGALVALGVSVVPMFASVRWLDRYYTATFGRQVANPRQLPRKVLFFFAYWGTAAVLNHLIPSIPAGAPTAATTAIAAVWVAIRDWPSRSYYLGAAVAVALGLALSAPVGGVLPPNLTLTVIFTLVGVSFVPIGILDHRLLVKLVAESRLAAPAIK